MSNKSNILIVVVVLVLLVLSGSVYVVSERQVAVITQFERLLGTEEKAGLKLKVPFLHKVEYFDARTQRLDVDPELFLTNEKKYLIVDYFVMWRIGDIRQFYTSVQGNFDRASSLLDQLVKDGLRGEFVRRSVKEVISEDRSSIMDTVMRELQRDAERYGVQIIGVRLKRVDFSDDIRDRVFDRMRAERERVSRSLRAQGREKSSVIRATAEREAATILAQAREKSAVMRGEADAQAARIYADSYGKDLEFYQFWQSMQAYRTSMATEDNLMIIEPDSEFFRYLPGSTQAEPLSASAQAQEAHVHAAAPAASALPPAADNPPQAETQADTVAERDSSL